MIVYHGSNVEVRTPRIIRPNRTLDFGNGFYLIIKKDNSESMFIVWRKDVHRIALHTELGGLQIQLRAGIQTVDKRQKQFVTVNEHSLMQVNDIFGKIIWISNTVNT